MISEDEWIDRAERRITMALEETVKQLEYEANALWKGKFVCGEDTLAPFATINAPVSRVALYYHPADYADETYMEIAVYVMIPGPEGDLEEMRVFDPRFPDAETP